MKKFKPIMILMYSICLLAVVCVHAQAYSESCEADIEECISSFIHEYMYCVGQRTYPEWGPIIEENTNTVLFTEMANYEVDSARFFDMWYNSFDCHLEDLVIQKVNDNQVKATFTVKSSIFFRDTLIETKRTIGYELYLQPENESWKIVSIYTDALGYQTYVDDLALPRSSSVEDIKEQTKALSEERLGNFESLSADELSIFRSGDADSIEMTRKTRDRENALISSQASSNSIWYNYYAAAAYADAFAESENPEFYIAIDSKGNNQDCTNYVSQCVWAGYGGWDFDNPSANAGNIASGYRMYKANGSDWYSNEWFGHRRGGSGPWETVDAHWNFVTKTHSKGPQGLGYNNNAVYTGVDAGTVYVGETLQLKKKGATKYAHSIFVTYLEHTEFEPYEYAGILCNAHNNKYYHEPLTTFISSFGGVQCYMRELVYGYADF